MYIIICLDDNNGLAFNHRRQSQDRIVAEDIRKTVGEKKLWITDYSRKLFQAVSNLEISENPKEEAKKGEYVFQELETLDTDDEQIEQFIIYRWNRVYPADVSVEIGAEWKLTETEEFPGFSHEKITKEMRKNREILKWKNNMRALARVICLALTMQFASGCGTTESAQSTQENVTTIVETFDFAAVPAYDGTAYVAVNDNVPFFTEEELSSASYETYGELDPLGRCTVCVASVGQDLMPAEERGNIGAVKPTGWHTVKYDFVDGKYLYNRCHLIGYQLTGENANEKNLITGTRYLNIEGMLPFENMVADYVKETDQHVMYRVTPVFEGDNLLAAGVLMEGKSVEDKGEGVLFCVFAYNVQPGVSIDYATGESSADRTIVNDTSAQEETSQSEETQTYVLNTNTHKFHKPGCYSVEKIKPENYAEFTGTREEAIAYGYDPCKNCNP